MPVPMEQMTGAQAGDRAAVKLLPDASEIRLSERALAVTRTLLAIAAVFVGYILPPATRSEWVQLLLFLYAVYSVILMLAIVGSTDLPVRLPVIVQAVD